jgi:Ca2+/H+ antiporter
MSYTQYMTMPNAGVIFDADHVLHTGEVAVKARGAADIIGIPFILAGTTVGLIAGGAGNRLGQGVGGVLVLCGTVAELTIYILALQVGLNQGK